MVVGGGVLYYLYSVFIRCVGHGTAPCYSLHSTVAYKKQTKSSFSAKGLRLWFITHPLIFARFYWLLYVTWCKITGQLSRNNPRLRGYLSSEFLLRKETKPAGKSQLKSFTFSCLLFYMGEKQICFVKSSDNEIKKPVANAVPESTKLKVNKLCSQVTSLKVKKVTSRLSDCESLFHMTVCQVLVQSQ